MPPLLGLGECFATVVLHLGGCFAVDLQLWRMLCHRGLAAWWMLGYHFHASCLLFPIINGNNESLLQVQFA